MSLEFPGQMTRIRPGAAHGRDKDALRKVAEFLPLALRGARRKSQHFVWTGFQQLSTLVYSYM